jgi:hypothetical protein
MRLCIEIRIDSKPCAEDHSSPRSPRHVLPRRQLTIVAFVKSLNYPRIDLEKVSIAHSFHKWTDLQADLPSCVDIGIIPTSSSVGGCRSDCWRLAWVVLRKGLAEFP